MIIKHSIDGSDDGCGRLIVALGQVLLAVPLTHEPERRPMAAAAASCAMR
jgi:hypothetical protein